MVAAGVAQHEIEDLEGERVLFLFRQRPEGVAYLLIAFAVQPHGRGEIGQVPRAISAGEVEEFGFERGEIQ